MESHTSYALTILRDAGDPCAKGLFDLSLLSPSVKNDLIQRMTAPGRHYHGLRHLEALWDRHCRYAPSSGLRRNDHVLVNLAIIYHDAVYESGARDNEMRSAALWLSVSADGAICSDDDRSWVADTIVATADHFAAAAALHLDRPDHLARQWMLDLDLSPLADAPDVFDANMANLAAEMPTGTPAQRRASLLDALRRFAAARHLFRCPPLREAFEQAARSNIARHLGHEIELPPPP